MPPLWIPAEPTRPADGWPQVIASSSSAVVLAPRLKPALLDCDAVVYDSDSSDRLLPISIAAGVAIVAAIGIIDQATQVTPTYEAHVKLAAESRGRTHLDIETQLEVMESPTLLEPVVDQLQARAIDINYDSLIQSLTLEARGETFDIRYRHPDAETAQAVIDQLSSTYLSHGHTCRQSACRGLQFIEAKLPAVQQQVQADQTQLRQLYASSAAPDRQAKLLQARTVEAQRQTIELEQRLSAAYREQATLKDRLSIREQTPASTTLQQDAPYQQTLEILRQVEQKIAVEFGRAQTDGQALRTLYQQHSSISAQLAQDAQGGLRRFLNNPRGPVDPVFQQPIYGELLQKLVGVVHQIEVLELRQKTLAQVEITLAEERHRVAGALSRYEAAQQRLLTSTHQLQRHIDRREQLQLEAAEESLTWELVSPPELIPPEEPALERWHHGLPEGSLYPAGAIAGLAVASAMAIAARRRHKVIEGEFV